MVKSLFVEVRYALPDRAWHWFGAVPLGSTVQYAIIQAMQHWPDFPVDWKTLSVGVFSQCVPWDYCVQTGDRVELYRPLLCDPKQKRRIRAKPKLKRKRPMPSDVIFKTL